MSKKSLADFLQANVERQMRLPHDFGAALDALREIKETLMHLPGNAWWDSQDALSVLNEYLYSHATPEEVHRRAEEGRRR